MDQLFDAKISALVARREAMLEPDEVAAGAPVNVGYPTPAASNSSVWSWGSSSR